MHLRRVCLLNGGYCTQWAYLVGQRSWGLTRFYAVFVYLEHPEHGACLIDTGYSPLFLRHTCPFPQRLYRWATPVHLDPGQDAWGILQAQGLPPEGVRQVFVSHFHGDHIAGLRHFPEAQFVFRRDAHAELLGERPFSQVRHGFVAGLLPADFVARGHGLDASAFAPGTDDLAEFLVHDWWGDGSLLFVDLPGHALGQMGFILRTETQRLFYIVDACWHLDVMLQARPLPRFSRGLQHSYPAYAQTQDKLRRLHAQGRYELLACHCPRTQTHVVNSCLARFNLGWLNS
jgi:glyoxylase-like metal-dependent hydrolase (beta-lactamase superfamily II)